MLSPKVQEKASKPLPPPGGGQEEIPGENFQESTNPEETRFGAKEGIALIFNHQFNAPRGERDFKFKREIHV